MGREEQPHVSALFECARSPEISQRFPLRNSFSNSHPHPKRVLPKWLPHPKTRVWARRPRPSQDAGSMPATRAPHWRSATRSHALTSRPRPLPLEVYVGDIPLPSLFPPEEEGEPRRLHSLRRHETPPVPEEEVARPRSPSDQPRCYARTQRLRASLGLTVPL